MSNIINAFVDMTVATLEREGHNFTGEETAILYSAILAARRAQHRQMRGKFERSGHPLPPDTEMK